jgi:hypothetical protein
MKYKGFFISVWISSLITMLLVGLKFSNIFNESWIWIFAPFWIPLIGCGVFGSIMLMLAGIVGLSENKK